MNDNDVALRIQMLADEHIESRQEAASWLRDHPEQSHPTLLALVQAAKPDQQTRWAIRLLGHLGYIADLPILADLLDRPESGLYWESAQSLAQHPSSGAMKILLDALKHNNVEVVGAAAVALGVRGSEAARTPLEELLQHPDETVRYRAVYALQRMGVGSSTDTLRSTLQREKSVQVRRLIEEVLDPKE